ncbi:C40 family peptidase [Planotetraspora sp. A-T 1434]|uniref:C40 family peptidase n=1 Tax=Planotetraspora sp. A-T 1434 TaxID=2979219 RepID=UPI0021BEB1B7|nr:C40 family peptidase [Planotetraspora sp. A-T 1434]MCT9931638.1 C40 family peptidase [Planotetraspora sp. A-T 1434]
MLDHRARVFTRVRKSLGRVLSEARQDLAYRPRMSGRAPWPSPWQDPLRDRARRSRNLRRDVPLIAVLLVSVLAADLVILEELGGPESQAVAVRYPQRPARQHGDYVAAVDERKPGPAEAATAAVAPLKRLVQPHLFVVANRALAPKVVDRVRHQKGVVAAEVTDAAEVTVDGKRVPTMGVDPSTFRAYTPSSTAGSDALWTNIAAGDMAVSFELGHDGGLELGSVVDGGGRRLRVGAYATVGMGSIAAIVSRQTASSLGIPEGNALVVSAPKADSRKLRARLLKILPKGSQVATINPVTVAPRTSPGGAGTVWPSTAFMSAQQLQVALQAAIGKLGRPYVWGAEGPDSFDCSGLVQWAYGQAGVRMPRVAAQQWASGPQIPLSQAQPGDLLFWRNDPTNPGYISHVAIYWGGDKMLHAPHTGDVVRIAKIYTRNLAGVVRISPLVSARVR